MSPPSEVKALTFHTPGDTAVRSIRLPPLRSTYMLIKVEYVALNPTDWKHITWGEGATPFSIMGCDYAGTVVAIGPDVTKPFNISDQVYGCAHGSNQSQADDGAFTEYAMVKADVAMHVPASSPTTISLTLDQLCTLPLGSITVGQGLFQPGEGKSLGLAWPGAGGGNGEWVFIAGGSTATGTLGIQLAKMAGYRVITTCSPGNFDFVRSRGADEVFDYHDPDCGPRIRHLTENTLRYAWDVAYTPELCDQALSSDSAIARYGTILGNEPPRLDYRSASSTSMYTMFGEAFDKYEEHSPAAPEDFEFAKQWMSLIETLVAEGKLTPHPGRIESGGLEGILAGLELLKAEKISGEKLVYRI
ncbi:GroES-like protein [Aspergillus sclerotiicarbonarius CBS 121057]|uniref:GroES-like protein n=1 Tax=Aspergillus sclerotiicarbonarius (strain CBS 121057 / IBT 28362) TaxID=1448318 RepID=A0A319E526_ASPSB|nr:GroES-like protein [Aspergillus sclerotiicarbonarius CBS 121057]